MSFVASHCPAFCAKRLPPQFDPQVVDLKKLCEGFSADCAPFGTVAVVDLIDEPRILFATLA
jgi:hypothetical protein